MIKNYTHRIPVRSRTAIDCFGIFEKMAEQNGIDCATMLPTEAEMDAYEGIAFWILYDGEIKHAMGCLIELFKYRVGMTTKMRLVKDEGNGDL